MSNTIEMAIMADLIYNKEGFCPYVEDTNLIPFIKAFEALVRADEREQILNFANSETFNRQHGERSPYAYELAAAIRARGETK